MKNVQAFYRLMKSTTREPNLTFQWPNGDRWKQVGDVVYRRKVGSEQWKPIQPNTFHDHGCNVNKAKRRWAGFPFDFLCKILRHTPGHNVFGRMLQHKCRYIRITRQSTMNKRGAIRIWWDNHAIEITGKHPHRELKRIEETCKLLLGGYKFGRLVKTAYEPAKRPKRRRRFKKQKLARLEREKRARDGSQPVPDPGQEKTG